MSYSSYDLEVAFFDHLSALTYTDMETLTPDGLQDEPNNRVTWRRGHVMTADPETIAIGCGVHSRIEGIYQIDLYVPRQSDNAFKTLKEMSDAHVNYFFPVNGRSQTLTRNQTSAHIVERPDQNYMGRQGAFLKESIDVVFYVEVPAS